MLRTSKGRTLFEHNGYLYYLERAAKVVGKKDIYKCVKYHKSGCKGRATDDGTEVTETGQHSHSPDVAKVEAVKICNRLKERATSSPDIRAKDLIATEVSSNPEVSASIRAALPSVSNMKRNIGRYRNRKNPSPVIAPKNPSSLLKTPENGLPTLDNVQFLASATSVSSETGFNQFCQNILCTLQQQPGLVELYFSSEAFAFKVHLLISLAFVPPADVIRAYDHLLNDTPLFSDETQMESVLTFFEATYIGVLHSGAANTRRSPQIEVHCWNQFDDLVNPQNGLNSMTSDEADARAELEELLHGYDFAQIDSFLQDVARKIKL